MTGLDVPLLIVNLDRLVFDYRLHLAIVDANKFEGILEDGVEFPISAVGRKVASTSD